jgi:DNA-binding MarR family transcriptional regulator
MRVEVKELTDNLAQVFKSIHQRSYHKMENKNIYPGQPKLLSLIKANEGITQKELSKMNFVKPATITGMLNKLEANHYLYRVPDEADKRIMRVYLTPEGRSLAEKSEMFMASLVEQLFDGFSDEELSSLLLMTQKLKDNLNKTDKT